MTLVAVVVRKHSHRKRVALVLRPDRRQVRMRRTQICAAEIQRLMRVTVALIKPGRRGPVSRPVPGHRTGKRFRSQDGLLAVVAFRKSGRLVARQVKGVEIRGGPVVGVALRGRGQI